MSESALRMEAQVLFLAHGLPEFYPGRSWNDASARLMDKGLAEPTEPKGEMADRGAAAIRLTPRGEEVATDFIGILGRVVNPKQAPPHPLLIVTSLDVPRRMYGGHVICVRPLAKSVMGYRISAVHVLGDVQRTPEVERWINEEVMTRITTP